MVKNFCNIKYKQSCRKVNGFDDNSSVIQQVSVQVILLFTNTLKYLQTKV